jgi:tryptophanyl-tRNA synthetase
MARLEAHYETVRERNGYDRVSGIDWLVEAGLDRRFVAVDGRGTVEAATDRETTVCMGVGMTGPPHLGTVGQILTGIALQAAGLDVQFVLADLEPYHGGAGLGRVRRLAERYREFALELGFDPKQGVLRTQEAAREVMHTAELLAPYYAPGDWGDGADTPATDWERAVGALYEERASDDSAAGPTSEAASAHSSVLHGADFLHPLYAEGYEQVIVALGFDEHGLTPWTRRFRDAASVEGSVAGLHSRMVPGFGDVPKMSKSVGAGVSLDMSGEAVRKRFASADDGGDPAASATFQAMCLASRYGAERLDRLESLCLADGEAWADARRAYADYVAGLAGRWRSTA